MGVLRNNINYIAEFSDKELELEFFNQYIQKAVRYIRPIMMCLGILNTLFIIPDYFFIGDFSAFIHAAAGRAVLFLIVLILFFGIKRTNNYRKFAVWITLGETAVVSLFFYVLNSYKNPDYLIQAFGVMVILMVLCMVPNRWIYTIAMSVFTSTGFLILSKSLIKGIEDREFWAGAVYIWIVIILSAILSFRSNYIERIWYMNNKELTRLSITDPLSGAFNRAKFNEEMEKWTGYAKRYNTDFSIAIIDFDDFKRINDNYGHLVGDMVIIEFVSLIKKNIRECDIFARWGGEEFILLLPNTNINQAVEFAERIRKSIENHDFYIAGKLTCSIGVAQMSPDDDETTLLKKVDNVLYAAKKAGKNKVVWF
ncbi:MAG TPA: diguanylate cyclase [Ruminiclostridium sp.]|jgi:diguanylate cyclase (GGDEF)-like protein|nr:GGDEF domain-containing protein [Clostridiaceae bacterium]HAA26172.1 diguanylate cyclase [Ruminiclostridium sp.]